MTDHPLRSSGGERGKKPSARGLGSGAKSALTATYGIKYKGGVPPARTEEVT